MSFAEEFRNMRQECQMSQEKIAHHIHAAYATVNRWEAGRTLPTMQNMSAIMEFCEAHGIDKERLFQSWKEEIVKKR